MALSACGSTPSPPTFDLSAPRMETRVGGSLRGQLAVQEPIALNAFDSERVIVRGGDGSLSFLGNAQWADRLPRLLQTRLIQSLENSSKITKVGRPGGTFTPDYSLVSDIRSFEARPEEGRAYIELSIKLVDERNGRILAARVVSGEAPLSAVEGPAVAQALDQALGAALVQIVTWVGR